MIGKILKKGFGTTSQLLSSKNIKKFITGDFPQALNYSRPFKVSKLDNGITVASQIMPTNIASISVFIKCGSRNQTQQSSGTAHFLQHLHFKGTKNRTRQQLQIGVQNIGGSLNAYTSRENTSYMMTVFKDDLSKSIEIVGDMITNSLYRKQDIQNERSTIHRQLLQTQKSNPFETTIQISHRGIYKQHQMGLPILGYIHNMQTISKEMIERYHKQNYVGQNIILVAAGPINHDQLIQATNKYIKVPRKSANPVKQMTVPVFTPGISALESNLTNLVNMVVIYQAPSFFDNQFFTYLLLQRILSDRPQTQLQLEIMKYSKLFRYQKQLSTLPFIQKQKGFYSSYWDTGLFGNYFLVQPQKTTETLQASLLALSKYTDQVTDQELQRAKRRVFVQVLQHQSQNDITQSIANNLMYYDRRVQTKQLAERIACVGAKQIQNLCKKLTQQQMFHVCFWGNTKNVPILKNAK